MYVGEGEGNYFSCLFLMNSQKKKKKIHPTMRNKSLSLHQPSLLMLCTGLVIPSHHSELPLLGGCPGGTAIVGQWVTVCLEDALCRRQSLVYHQRIVSYWFRSQKRNQ